MENQFQMVAKTFQGLEDVLRDELIELGAENVEMGVRMVSFEGDTEMLYRANLCCRTALRILKPIVKFTADSTDELYDKVRELDWEQFMTLDSTFSIDSTVNGEEFTHSRFVTYRVKDAIADHFNDKYGKRPSIRVDGADIQLNVHIAENRVTISLDSSGEPLSKRGYRTNQGDAPINEVLAAGIIMKTGWRGDTDFADPMCGSGTFLIEAALIAANINPGIYREHFAFEKWPDFDQELFEELYDDDSGEREFAHKIYGGDIDPDMVAIARKNIKEAHLDDMIELTCKSVTDWTDNAPEGILVTNPPYGERLKPENIGALYKSIGTALKNYFQGWHAWIIGLDDKNFSEIGLKPSVKIPLYNGSLECSLREYVMFDGKYSEFRADGGSVANTSVRKDSSQGPKKVRHISEDDWKKETKKSGFKSSGHKQEGDGKKPFNRNNRDDKREKEIRGNRQDFRDFDEDDNYDFAPRAMEERGRNDRQAPQHRGRDGRPSFDRKPAFDRDRNRDGRPSFDRKPSFDRDRNRDGRPSFDRKPSFDRDRNRDGRPSFDRKPSFDRDRNRDGRPSFDRKPSFDRDRNRDGRPSFDRKPSFDRDRNRDERGDRNFERGEYRRYDASRTSYDPKNSKGPKISADRETIINPVHMRGRKKQKEEGQEED